MNPYRAPSALEIKAAEDRLGLRFHPDYIAFLEGGCDVADAPLEPAVVTMSDRMLGLVEVAENAWNEVGVPRDLLPFIEDNGDYYCLNPRGEVVFWSHNGPSDEKWPNIAAWRQQVCIDERK